MADTSRNSENSIPVPRGVVVALVIAIFIGSGSLLFDSLIRNPNADLKKLNERVHVLERDINLLSYRVSECMKRAK